MDMNRRGVLGVLLGGAALGLGGCARNLASSYPEGAAVQKTPITIITDHRGVPYYGVQSASGEFVNSGEPLRPSVRACNAVGVEITDVIGASAVAGGLYGWAGALIAGGATLIGSRVADEFFTSDRATMELTCIERARWERANWGQSTLKGVPAPGGGLSMIGDDGWEKALAGGWTEDNLNRAIEEAVTKGRGVPQVCSMDNGPRAVLVTGYQEQRSWGFGRTSPLFIAEPNGRFVNKVGRVYSNVRSLNSCERISFEGPR